jgi:hypothetical protein
MSGLPDLTMDDTSHALTLADVVELFREEQNVSAKDMLLLRTFLFENDCKNIISRLKGKTDVPMLYGNFSPEQLDELVAVAADSDEGNDTEYPDFLIEFMRNYEEHKDESGYFVDDDLMIRYWEYAKASKSELVSAWADLNVNVSNILAAFIAASQELNAAEYLVGDNEVNDMIRTSKAKDYDLGREYDYVPTVMQIVACDNPVEKERRIDALKWLWLDEQTFFNPFSMDAFYAYLCKVQMHERWRILDPVFGKQRFESIIESLRREVQVPDEFKVASPFAAK